MTRAMNHRHYTGQALDGSFTKPSSRSLEKAGNYSEASRVNAATSLNSLSGLGVLNLPNVAATHKGSYVSQWLQRNDSDSSRTAYNVSPTTVIHASDSTNQPELYKQSDPITWSILDGDDCAVSQAPSVVPTDAIAFLEERAERPRSLSRSRGSGVSLRSQRPRSPSPVRRLSIGIPREPEGMDDGSSRPGSYEASENLLRRERPRRPRSPSPERTAKLPMTVSPNRLSSDGASQRLNQIEDIAWQETVGSFHESEDVEGAVLSDCSSTTSEDVPRRPTRLPFEILPSQSDLRPSGQNTACFDSQQPSNATFRDSGAGSGIRGPRISNDKALDNTSAPMNELLTVPPFAPMPPHTTTALLPPHSTMMPTVINIARSLAGARPRRPLSDGVDRMPAQDTTPPSKLGEASLPRAPRYTDAATQTTDALELAAENLRLPERSPPQRIPTITRGVQTSQLFVHPISENGIDSASYPRLSVKDSQPSFRWEIDSTSNGNSLRQSLRIAKTQPPPKKPAVNAKATRISRILVNSEALSLLDIPHEQQDEHIVVHRIMSREEIIKVAELTIDIREARSRGGDRRQRMWEQWQAGRYLDSNRHNNT